MRRIIRGERGIAIVGTALALPLLLLGSVGIFEVGRAYETSQTLTNAAREGARVAGAADTVEAKVRHYLQASGLNCDSSVGVTITRAADGGDAKAPGSEVTISYPFQFVVLQPVAQLLVSGSMVDSPITVTATSAMRNQAGS